VAAATSFSGQSALHFNWRGHMWRKGGGPWEACCWPGRNAPSRQGLQRRRAQRRRSVAARWLGHTCPMENVHTQLKTLPVLPNPKDTLKAVKTTQSQDVSIITTTWIRGLPSFKERGPDQPASDQESAGIPGEIPSSNTV